MVYSASGSQVPADLWHGDYVMLRSQSYPLPGRSAAYYYLMGAGSKGDVAGTIFVEQNNTAPSKNNRFPIWQFQRDVQARGGPQHIRFTGNLDPVNATSPPTARVPLRSVRLVDAAFRSSLSSKGEEESEIQVLIPATRLSGQGKVNDVEWSAISTRMDCP